MNDDSPSNVAYALKDVTFSYSRGKRAGSEAVLHELSCLILSGRVLGILGPNGSGKASLLMTIMGYPQYKVTAGKIIFKGEDITDLPIDERAQLGIGMSFQRVHPP